MTRTVDRRTVAALGAVLVGLSLLGAPVTMADWAEQGSFSVEPVEQSQLREETPVVRYDELSPPARDAVRRAIESPDGSTVVYGSEDLPDRFFYSDYAAPGQGMYGVVYEGQHYRLTTYASGGFPFVYWLLELPFVVYGAVLVGVAGWTYRGARPVTPTALATLVGAGFHLLGPEFDFPLLDPIGFVGLGIVATGGLVVWLVRDATRENHTTAAG